MIAFRRAGTCGLARGVVRVEDRGGERVVGGTWEVIRVVVLGGVHDCLRHRGAAGLSRGAGGHGEEDVIWGARTKLPDGGRLLVGVSPCLHSIF